MGLRFRKSINLGCGFRINLSKTGVGYSWGVPGYRITKLANGKVRKTTSLPGTGISYVEESGGNSKRNSDKSYPREPINQTDGMHEIKNADIEEMQSVEYQELITKLQKVLKINFLSNVLLWCTLLVGIPGLVILPIIGIILKILIRTIWRVNIDYTFNDNTRELYDKKIAVWLILNNSIKTWQITHEMTVSDKKISAGATRSINRILFKVVRKVPPYIKINISPVWIPLRKEKILMLPDKILVIRGNKVGVVGYEKFNISITQTSFVEDQPLTPDAKVIDYTWQYVNKNGDSDKRYKNNRQLPICLYGNIKITSPEGLNIEMQTSCLETAQELGDALVEAKV